MYTNCRKEKVLYLILNNCLTKNPESKIPKMVGVYQNWPTQTQSNCDLGFVDLTLEYRHYQIVSKLYTVKPEKV